MSRYRDITLTLVRWALGALFIFSGAVKCVDPVGTSIFVDKYLATYSMEWLMPISESLAVGLSVFEFTLGALLISGVWRRFTALTAVVVLLLFSVITLLNATVLPIGDCGCFGDAVKLSPWATFFKNII
ncbi:MAG: DoxX family protein, partial [Alistipes sp.]|nr:DoxX family protein [Alistipes sp.]